MSEKTERKKVKDQTDLSLKVGAKALRKLKAKRNPAPGVWFGLGMMGLVGWSVVVPTLLGAAIGYWLDSRYEKTYSFTLMLLFIGLLIGCLNAWHWVRQEDKDMNKEQEEEEDKDE